METGHGMAYRDHHATIFVPPPVAAPIEAVRRAWDPVMAAQLAAHVTLVYPQEAPLVALLVARVRAASAEAAPFRLRLGAVAYLEQPAGGVYVEVLDLDGGYHRLRAGVLRPPCTPLAFPPHVTLIHPRTSSRGPAFWAPGQHHQHDLEFTVDEVAITAYGGTRWAIVERCACSRRG